MKQEVYSTYEAKARLSEILRKVQNNKRIIITHRGKPIAEIGPIKSQLATLADHLAELTEKGILSRGDRAAREMISPVVQRPGALERFLDDRD
jgi:prevent-host-death family protein